MSPAANLEARIRKLEPVGGRVSPRTVRRLARATRVSAAVVERELAALGLAVERVPRLPLAPPVDERGLADALRALDCRHIVDFLLDGAGHGFVTVDSLYIVAGKLRRVPVRHPELAKLRARWDRRDDIGRRAAAYWLLDALSRMLDEDPMGVRRLALVQVTELLRAELDSGLLRHQLPAAARRLGVRDSEADLLAFIVDESNTVAARFNDALAGALAARRVRAVEQIMRSVPADLRDEDVRRLVASAREAVRTVRKLISAARAHERERDTEAAASDYLRAAALVSDYPALADALARCPPAPPEELILVPEERAVALTWPPSPATAGTIDYRVVCTIASPARTPDSGRIVEETADLYARDLAAPVGHALLYTVFARRNGRWWSSAGTGAGPVTLAPPLAQVRHRMRHGSAMIRWEPPRAGRVRILRVEYPAAGDWTDAVEVPEERPGQISDSDLTLGVTYLYQLVVVYDGGLESPERIVAITADIDPVPISSLVVRTDSGEGVARLSWGDEANGEVHFMETAEPDVLTPGTFLDGNKCAELAGVRHVAPAGSRELEIPLEGRRYLTPLTVRGERAVVGTGHVAAAQTPVSELKLRRFRGEIRALWRWPEPCARALVVAEGADCPPGEDPDAIHVEVTRSAYDHGGGCRIPIADARHRVSVTAVGVIDGELVRARPVVATVGPQRAGARLGYAVQPVARRRLTPGRRAPAAVLRIFAYNVPGPLEFVLVARPGHTRPLERSDPRCRPLLAVPIVAGTADAPLEVPFSLEGLRRPFYLRGFVDDDAADVEDPPRDQLLHT